MALEHQVAWCLIPLAFWVLLSGLDDLFIALVYLTTRKKPFPWPADADLETVAERRIAIFVPLWREHRVIGRGRQRAGDAHGAQHVARAHATGAG